MKGLRIGYIVVALVLLSSGLTFAQSQASHLVTMQVSSIARLGIYGGNITLVIGAPATPGDPPADATNSTCYLQYTATTPMGLARRITVAWGASDSSPAGTELRVTATPSGGTNEGSSTGQQTISESAQDVLTGIRSCRTGTGPTNGANLVYVLAVTSVTDLVAGETTSATVTYTLTDAS